ncbi:MAG TPA: VWA domain-containing protein [Gemmataceae bacterium]|nr:VWA domain-containing protein [Gemmataceae bacterium]
MFRWKRSARLLPAVALGGLCLVLTACGEYSARKAASSADTRKGGEAAEMAPPLSKAEPSFDKQKREEYAPIVENGYQWVKTSPVSTFSADVNTASYSNVRRFLNEGKFPPRDAVLLAEMVNYFPYRYPQPTGDDPVSISLELAPCPWKDGHYLARIGVRARTLDPSAMPPRNLVFLIDTSGSMQEPTRLPLVKQSLDLLINQLTEKDRVTIVTYAGDAGVRLPPTPGSQKETIRAAVHSLHAGGSTYGEGGIRVAYDQASKSFVEGGVNRVILCTDGDFNVGVQNESELLQLIEQKRTSRVYLTVLGYGMGNLKDNKVRLLANHGNGHYAYIDSIDEARKVFVEQGGALAVVAKDVKFQAEFNPVRVSAYRLIGYENRLLKTEDFKNDAKDAGDMGSGHTVTAFYEVVPVGVKIDLPEPDPLKYQNQAPANSSREWLTVRMRYKEPDANASKEQIAVLADGSEKVEAAEDFRFASAVVEFGMLLRDSPYKGSGNLPAVLQRAVSSASYDPNGHRAEFVRLVKKATDLRAQQTKD